MGMGKLILWILLLLVGQQVAAAQELRQDICGTVADRQSKERMEGVQVRLLNSEGKMVAGVLTKEKGRFLLPSVSAGKYVVRVSVIGYKEQDIPVQLPVRGKVLRLSRIMMRMESEKMDGVVVTAKALGMTAVEDTMAFSAAAYKVNEGAVVEELIERLPGITQDGDGNFLFNGKKVEQFLVDGKEFFGSNSEMTLKNLPADIVDRVKAYNKQSDRARITDIDDGEEKMVIDLQIKKNRKRGWMGNAGGGYGTHDRYQGRLNVNRFVGEQKYALVGNVGNTGQNGTASQQKLGATMNVQNKKLELNGQVNGDFSQSESRTWTSRESFENKKAPYQNSQSRNRGYNRGGNLSYRIEWKPDSTWNILVRPAAAVSRKWGRNESEIVNFHTNPYELSDDPLGDYTDLRDIAVNHRLQNNRSLDRDWNVGLQTQVNKRLGRAGRNLTLNLDGELRHGDRESDSYNRVDYYQLSAVTGEDSIFHKSQFNHALQNHRGWSAQVGYSEPLTRDIHLQFNYSYRYRWSDNDRRVYSIFDWMAPGAPAVPDTAQMRRTENIYQNHNLRLQLCINKPKYQLTVGANVQPQTSRVKYEKGWNRYNLCQTVVNASPAIRFRYRFSRYETLNLQYNGRTGQPSITDLIPDTLSNADPLNIRLGNPELKPSFTQNMNVDYNRTVTDKQRTNAVNLQASITQNATTNRTEYNDITGGRVSKPVNINGNWSVKTTYTFNTALGPKQHWRMNMGTELRYTNAVGYVYRRSTSTTLKNTTRGTDVRQSVRILYRKDWESGWKLEANANGSFRLNHSRRTNSAAANLDTRHYNYGAGVDVTTPWGMTFSSGLSEQSRRGYTSAPMNTNLLIWSASLSQQFLKKKLTLTLRANDILNRRDDVSRSVTATSCTDRRQEVINSYWMLTASYRFGKFGGRKSR